MHNSETVVHNFKGAVSSILSVCTAFGCVQLVTFVITPGTWLVATVGTCLESQGKES